MSVYRSLGALSFPLDPNDFTTTLVPLDPARDTLLALFESAINDEFGATWTKVISGVDPLDSATTPVMSKWPGPPTKELVQHQKITFPALFLYRDGTAELDEHTLAEERLTQNWGLDYILTPLASDDYRRISDILIGVAKLIRIVVRKKGHSSYQGGALVTTGAGLSTVAVTRQQIGSARFSPDEVAYLSVSMGLQTTELSGFVDGEDAEFQHFDLDVGTGNADGLVNPLVTVASDEVLQAPAITPPYPAKQ